MHETSAVIELVALVVVLLFIAGAVRAFTKLVNVPFTVALVVVGIALRYFAEHGPEILRPFAEHEISPDVILFVFLPTLIFESALNMDARQLKQNLLPILTLAVPGLVLSTSIIGGLVWWLTPFDLASSLLLGSILSATDPVAVIAMFRTLGVPMRLTILVEGESLFNDATALVASRLLMGVVAGGFVLTPATAFSSGVDFLTVFVGGAVVGWLCARAVGLLLGRVDSDPYIEISLTTILAYLSFLIAEEVFHVSGVMATVAAGLTMGSWGRAKISGSVAGFMEHFWEYLAFIANALIFLFVGLRVNLAELYDSLDILVWVILAMLLSRAVVIYALVPLVGRFPGALPVERAYQTVMYWGGLRGAIALAIVLSLKDFAHAETFVALVMGVVLFTLLVQGLSIETLVQWLGLDKAPLADQVGSAEGLLNAKKKALARIPELQSGGLFSARIAEELGSQFNDEMKVLRDELEELRYQELDSQDERLLIYSRVFTAEKAIYYELFTSGNIPERVYRDLCHAIDHEADALRHGVALSRDPLNLRASRPVHAALYKAYDALLGFTGLPERERLNHVSREYEEAWGRYQGCYRVLENLDTLVFAESARPGIVAEVRKRYRIWLEVAQNHIDTMAEEFPEFVNAVQERLARRLMVHAETQIIETEARIGSIPAGVREKVLEKLNKEIRLLRGQDFGELRLDAKELLRKVPFFHDMPEFDFTQVAARLVQRTIPTGKSIIRQGEKGETLYLIGRGVVRVSTKANDEDHDLATLIAGDFFGEMALLRGARRTATCRAVTPVAVYELRRKDFDEVCRVCPSIQAALKKADKERSEELDKL